MEARTEEVLEDGAVIVLNSATIGLGVDVVCSSKTLQDSSGIEWITPRHMLKIRLCFVS